ncbi:MAG: T9SS type A sorting domain-containing protein [Saprospiraceae bacterium]|nr:T9SS type A sorting domain-containing protein [Saprospiraceae bacterium]
MLRLIISSILLGITLISYSQQWQSLKPEAIEGLSDRTLPFSFHIASTDLAEVAESLKNHRVDLVMPDGSLETFKAILHSNFSPRLAQRYAQIKSYLIESAGDRQIKGRLDLSVHGLHAVLQHPDGEIYLDPIVEGRLQDYMVYHTKDYRVDPELKALYDRHEHPFASGPSDFLEQKPVRSPFSRNQVEADVVSRTYRLAVSATGEYTQKHNGTVEGALAAINTALNRINFVLESEVAVSLELIESNDSLIFTDGTTDPFTNGNASTMALENNNFLTANLGLANFDVGHVFGTNCNTVVGVSGGIGIVCGSLKGFGSSCEVASNDRFYIDVICHELGHQFGAEHTWNNCPSAPDDQFSSKTAFEPGSGSTIMSYAGSCGNQNIQGTADPYYHGNSIEAIKNFISSSDGQCGVSEVTSNRDPSIEIKLEDGFFIPIMTPFKLTAEGQDPDDDPITYSWEQFDPGVGSASLSPIEAPRGDAPVFRSSPPSDSPTRYFPALEKVLTNTFDNTEVLPTYDRKLTFRATVRDHVQPAGGVSWDQVSFRATSQSGPFEIIDTSLPDTLTAGDYMEIMWDVAGTNLLPVNCQSINILLSLDGGQTFVDTLITHTANDGNEFILIPDVETSQARILIEADDNIFYTVNRDTLVIERSALSGFAIDLEPHEQSTCLPSVIDFAVNSFAIGSFSDSIEILAVDLPDGAIQVPLGKISPGDPATVQIDLARVGAPGNYQINFQVISAGDTLVRSVRVNALSSDFSDLMLLDPPMGENAVSTRPTFTWQGSANALAYHLQVDISPSFSAPQEIMTTNITAAVVDSMLDENTLYYWRIRPANSCGEGAYSEINTFHTINLACEEFAALDLPLPLTQSAQVQRQSNIEVQNSGIVKDVNISSIQGFHESFGDLIFTLRAPSGKEVILVDRQCGFSNRTFDMGFDDQALDTLSCQASFNDQIFIPQGSLADFEDENTDGIWSLIVADSVIGSGGRIEAWSLELCGSLSPLSPIITLADTVRAAFASTTIIDDQSILVTDEESLPEDLIYTLVRDVQSGSLLLDDVVMNPGAQFSQADLNLGKVSYVHEGLDSMPDGFLVAVEDGTGGWIAPFNIPILISTEVVSTFHFPKLENVTIFPNPVKTEMYIRNDGRLLENVAVSILSLDGRLLQRQQLRLEHLATMDVQHLTAGFYTIQILSAQGIANFRFVKQ